MIGKLIPSLDSSSILLGSIKEESEKIVTLFFYVVALVDSYWD